MKGIMLLMVALIKEKVPDDLLIKELKNFLF